MTVSIFQPSLVRAVDDNGNPISGAKMYFYLTDTLTAATWYLDGEGTTPGTNPHVANAAGLFDPVFLSDGVDYRIALKTAADATVWDVDPIVGGSDSGDVSFIASGTGAVARTVQAKLRELPKSSNDYDTFAHYTASLPTGFFAQNGADIQRFGRLMAGGAQLNDCLYPNVAQDWLSQFQVAAGLSNGLPLSAQVASLNYGPTDDTAAVGVLGGIQSLNFASAGTSAIGVTAFVVNNNTTLATKAWAFYAEAHKLNATCGETVVMELDTRTLVDSIAPTPWQQGDVIGIQLASGAELAGAGQYDASVGIQFAANPKKFKVGLNFMNDSLTDGLAICLAAAASNGHRLQWINASGYSAGLITSSSTGSNAGRIAFTNNGIQVAGADGTTVAYFNPLASGTNYLTFSGGTGASAPVIGASSGTNSDVDLFLATQGTGKVTFGTNQVAANGTVATALSSVGPTGSNTTVQEWLVVKNNAGTLRYIPMF